MIKCRLCNQDFQVINTTHLKPTHDMTTEEYLEMFPDAETFDTGLRRQIAESATGRPKPKDEETSQRIAESCSAYWTEEKKREQSELLMGNQNALGHVVSETSRHVMSELKLGKELSEKHRQDISDTLMGHEVSEKTRRQISESSLGKVMSEEAKQLLREANLGKTLSEASKNLISKIHLGKITREETKKLMSEAAKENWKDPEFAKMMFRAFNLRPNNSELQLQSILDKRFPGEWEYVGDGKDDKNWFEGRNPDFINVNGRKQVIEMFGIYYHDPILFPNRPTEEELIAHYKTYGIDCLVIWEYDIFDEDEVVKRVMEMQRDN